MPTPLLTLPGVAYAGAGPLTHWPALTAAGFVCLEPLLPVPSAADVAVVSKMFRKSSLKHTQALHPLWARGLRSQTLALTLTDENLTVSDGSGTVLDTPVFKVFLAAAVKAALFVFVRRSGTVGTFKAHAFTLASPADATRAAAMITTVSNALGFRRESMSLAPRCGSIASIDMLFSPSVVVSPASSAPASDAEASDDEFELPPAAFIPPTPPTDAAADDQPCGICRSADGDNWIALKTCAHQFHLPCMSAYRCEHNLCPVCCEPVSASTFSLRYIGGTFNETEPAPADLADLALDYRQASELDECLRVSVTPTHVNFLDRVGTSASRVRSVNRRADLRHVLLLNNQQIALVFADGDGFLAQLLEPPTLAEAPAVCAALQAACGCH